MLPKAVGGLLQAVELWAAVAGVLGRCIPPFSALRLSRQGAKQICGKQPIPRALDGHRCIHSKIVVFYQEEGSQIHLQVHPGVERLALRKDVTCARMLSTVAGDEH